MPEEYNNKLMEEFYKRFTYEEEGFGVPLDGEDTYTAINEDLKLNILKSFISQKLQQAYNQGAKDKVEEVIKLEEWKRRGDMHPMWNKAKTNTVQELKASLTSKEI